MIEAQAVSRSAAGPVEVLIVVNPCFGLDIASTEEIRTGLWSIWFAIAPPSPALGIRTVQPMFVYEAMGRRPISTNMLARTGSRK